MMALISTTGIIEPAIITHTILFVAIKLTPRT